MTDTLTHLTFNSRHFESWLLAQRPGRTWEDPFNMYINSLLDTEKGVMSTEFLSDTFYLTKGDRKRISKLYTMLNGERVSAETALQFWRATQKDGDI